MTHVLSLKIPKPWIRPASSREGRKFFVGLLKKAAVPAPELPAFVAEATSAESARQAGQQRVLRAGSGLDGPFGKTQSMLF